LQDEITAVKGVLQEEKELNAKRHEDLLAILAALTAKLSPPAPEIIPCPAVSSLLHPVSFLFCYPLSTLRTMVFACLCVFD